MQDHAVYSIDNYVWLSNFSFIQYINIINSHLWKPLFCYLSSRLLLEETRWQAYIIIEWKTQWMTVHTRFIQWWRENQWTSVRMDLSTSNDWIIWTQEHCSFGMKFHQKPRRDAILVETRALKSRPIKRCHQPSWMIYIMRYWGNVDSLTAALGPLIVIFHVFEVNIANTISSFKYIPTISSVIFYNNLLFFY